MALLQHPITLKDTYTLITKCLLHLFTIKSRIIYK